MMHLVLKAFQFGYRVIRILNNSPGLMPDIIESSDIIACGHLLVIAERGGRWG